MAFQQYTRCVEPSEYAARIRIITIQTLLTGVPAALIAVATGHPECLWLVLEILFMAGWVAYCRNFLYARLICLGGDREVIGAVVSVSPPATRLTDGDWDTDYGINLLLENTEFGVSQRDAQDSTPYGYLVTPQPGVTALGFMPKGHSAIDVNDAEHPGGTGKEAWGLHVEFEGAGNYDLLLGAEAGLGLAIAGLAACILLPFPAGPIVAAILAVLGLLAWIIAAVIGNGDTGSPTDVDPDIGVIHTNADPNGGRGAGTDILYVQGTWVFDPIHEGWNEIHPVKRCTKMGTWDGSWGMQEGVILRIREAFEVAEAEETQAAQALPEHQWQLHPDLDGCSRVIIG